MCINAITSTKTFFAQSKTKVSTTYGNFILMNTLHIKKEIRMDINPTEMRRIRFRRGMEWFVLSSITNPSPPIVKRKLEANPSIMY